MARPIEFSTPGTSPQRERRAHRTFTDQHGRQFSTVVDKETNTPIGEMRPLNSAAPWYPTQPYAVFSANGDSVFRWDYKRLSDELGGMVSVYYDFAIEEALKYNLPVPEVGGVVDRRVRSLCGIPPFSPAIPLACEMGDPWMLGLPDAKPSAGMEDIVRQNIAIFGNANEALATIRAQLEQALGHRISAPVAEAAEAAPAPLAPVDAVPTTYPAYFAWAKGHGMKPAEIGAAWKDHKANLAAEMVGA